MADRGQRRLIRIENDMISVEYNEVDDVLEPPQKYLSLVCGGCEGVKKTCCNVWILDVSP